jgi:predicted nucleotidyltransferase
MFPPDFKELLSDLNSQNARYLIIGGYAVGVHSQPRATKDLDIFIRPDPENAKAVYAALAKFGAPLQGVTPEDLIDKGSFFRMGHAPLMVDVLANISGVDFESAWNSRIEIEIDPGLKVPVISSEDLIKAKLAAGRDQDILDVKAVREAQKQRVLDEVANGLEAPGGNGQKTHERDRER